MAKHGRGKKRLRFQLVEGHRFAYKRNGKVARGDLSLCGLTLESASASDGSRECQPCAQAAKQLWA